MCIWIGHNNFFFLLSSVVYVKNQTAILTLKGVAPESIILSPWSECGCVYVGLDDSTSSRFNTKLTSIPSSNKETSETSSTY